MHVTVRMLAVIILAFFTLAHFVSASSAEIDPALHPANDASTPDDAKQLPAWLDKAADAATQATYNEPFSRSEALRSITMLHVRLQMFSEAVKNANSGGTIFNKLFLLAAIVHAMPVEREDERVKILGNIVATAPQIVEPLLRARVLLYASKALDECGKHGDAVATLAAAAEAVRKFGGDPLECASALIGIAKTQLAFGQVDEAKKSFADARDIIKKQKTLGIGIYHIMQGLCELANAQAKAGLYSDALAAAEILNDDGDMKAKVLIAVAGAQINAGEKKAAADTFASALASATNKDEYDIPSEYPARSDVVMAMIDAGSFLEALAAARETAYDDARPKLLQYLAEKEAAAGLYSDAMTVATSLEGYWKFETLDRIGVAQARAGHYDEARATVQEIIDAHWESAAIRTIAALQLASGEVTQAAVTLKELPISESSIELRVAIARAEAKAGNKDEASVILADTVIWVMKDLGDPRLSQVLIDASVVQAEIGNREDAKKNFNALLADLTRPAVLFPDMKRLSALAVGQEKAGFHDDATTTFAIATERALKQDPSSKAYDFGVLAETLAEADFTDMLTTIYAKLKDEPAFIRASYCVGAAFGFYWKTHPDEKHVEWNVFVDEHAAFPYR